MGYTKEDHAKAMAVLKDSNSTREECYEATKITIAYHEQIEKDCLVCRTHFNFSSGGEGKHYEACPHHPAAYGELASAARCIMCGTDTSCSHVAGVGATVWKTRGNYGSVLVDRMGADSGELRIEICDTCLIMKRSRVLDTGYGKLKLWEPPVPEGRKGDRINIYQREDGNWVGTIHFENGCVMYKNGDSALEVLEKIAKSESRMMDGGYPLGAKDSCEAF